MDNETQNSESEITIKNASSEDRPLAESSHTSSIGVREASTQYRDVREQGRVALIHKLRGSFEEDIENTKQRILSELRDQRQSNASLQFSPAELAQTARKEVVRTYREQISDYDRKTRLNEGLVIAAHEAREREQCKDIRRHARLEMQNENKARGR